MPDLFIPLAVAAVVVLVFLIVHHTREALRKPETVTVPPKPKKDNQLATLVWSAHVANQEHDLAVLTGTPEQMADTLLNTIHTNNRLEQYLRSRRAAADAVDRKVNPDD